jgi:hypothetical protein
MKARSWSQGLGIYAAVALLAACGGGSQLGANPIQPNVPQTRTSLALIDRPALAGPVPSRSWMAPEAKKSDLAYISNFYGSDILAFTYPDGNYVGSISGVTDANFLCAAKTGNWWVVASDEVLEYAHGGTTPLKTLSVTAGDPEGCAVDPITGNLAVTIGSAGDVVVFTGGSGSGTTIADDLSASYFASYDDKGDLFVNGITPSDTNAIVELPKGSSRFETITLQPNIQTGGVQWHGDYLAVKGIGIVGGGIYHFAIHGTKGKEIGFTQLAGFSGIAQFWIAGRYVVGADFPNETADMWKYPAGGPVFKHLAGSYDGPIGATVSVAEKR